MKRSAATALMPFTARIAEQVEKFGADIRPYPFVSGRMPERTAEEEALRILVSSDCDITKAPPFLIAQLKKRLADFNASTMTWRKS